MLNFSHIRWIRTVAAVAAVAWIGVTAFSGGAEAQKAVPGSAEAITLSFAPLVKQAAPAVVNIFTSKAVTQRVSPLFDDPFFRRFFGDALPQQRRERTETSLGSGVIVEPDGSISSCLLDVTIVSGGHPTLDDPTRHRCDSDTTLTRARHEAA